jgi:amidohydrolase
MAPRQPLRPFAHAMNTLRPSIEQLQPALAGIRRDLHAHPELKFEEHRTAAKVAEQLSAAGYEVHTGLGGTGLVATLEGRDPARGIVLRADMDALPLTEANGFEHASVNTGRMHACGHDGHTTMLLGAAKLMKRLPQLPGSVHFVFQPGEEGGAGAREMMDDGLFERFPTEAVFGMHNWPGLPAGVFGLRAGCIMAAGGRFHIVVKGRGTHAAQPHLGLDPIPVLAALILQMQTLVARYRNPLEPVVMSVCTLRAGEADNIIPDTAEMRGTIRTLSTPELRAMQQQVRQLCEGMAQSYGVQISADFPQYYPATVNTAPHARFCERVMAETFGPARVHGDVPPNMTSEDFGFMLEERPGAYVLIGNRAEAGHAATLHNPSYDFNDAIIPDGVEYWIRLAHAYFDAPELR